MKKHIFDINQVITHISTDSRSGYFQIPALSYHVLLFSFHMSRKQHCCWEFFYEDGFEKLYENIIFLNMYFMQLHPDTKIFVVIFKNYFMCAGFCSKKCKCFGPNRSNLLRWCSLKSFKTIFSIKISLFCRRNYIYSLILFPPNKRF